MDKNDSLDKLIVDENEKPDLSLLASLINGYTKFTKSGTIIPSENFYNQPEWKRVLLVILTNKAMFIKQFIKDEAFTYKEIGNMARVPPKNVSKIFNVELKGIIEKRNSRYFIPNYNLFRCKEVLKVKTKRS